MIASERRIVSEGETRHSLTKKLALSGRPVKIYVIDPKQFQARLQKYTAETESKKSNNNDDVKSGVKRTPQKSEEQHPPPPLQKYTTTNRMYEEIDEQQYKISHRPVLIAPKEPLPPQTMSSTNGGGGTTIFFPPTLLPLQTIIPVSLSVNAVGNIISLPCGGGGIVTSLSSSSQQGPCNNVKKKKVVKKNTKRPVKRSNLLTGEISKRNSISEEKAEAAEMAFLMKESTTRTGRVCKSTTMAPSLVASTRKEVASQPQNGPSSPGGTKTNDHQGVVQIPTKPKRAPPEKFKCQTCQRFYLGNAKFNQHFAKFPDHVKPDPNAKKKTSNHKRNGTSKSSNNNEGYQQDIRSGGGVGMSQTPLTAAPPSENTANNGRENQSKDHPLNPLPFTPMDEDDSFGTLSPIVRRRSTASLVNPDTLSDNCTSPKNLPAFSSSSPPPSTSQPNNNLVQQQQRREYFMEFQTTDFNRTSIPHHQIPTSSSPGGTGNRGNTDVSTFFSAASTSSTSINTCSELRHHLHNSSVNVSSYVSVNSCRNPVPSVSTSPPLRLEGGDEEGSRDNCVFQTPQSPYNHGQALKRKSIWEFVKEQIRLCGINQTCGEISEMADKLSKIARDKFYPIQEDEAERLTASPKIQVDTPFISHLLDLPFGTYIFKEDGGMRKIIPPPTPVSSTELSLTNGVEVDVDKFLSPDIDLISLPHLTNLDFNSICN